MKKGSLLLVCVFLIALLVPSTAEAGEPSALRIPVSAFATLPQIRSARLSPNGEYLAVLRNYKGRTLLMTQKLFSGEDPKLVTNSDNVEAKIRWASWANNERLLVSIIFASHRDGIPLMETRLLAVNYDGSDPKNMVKLDYTQSGTEQHESQFRDDVIDFLLDDEKHVLVGADLDKPGAPSVYRINIYTGKRKRIQSARAPISDWMTDWQGRLRIGSGYKDTDFSIFLKDPKGRKWRMVWDYKIFEDPAIEPLAFDADPNILYVRYPHKDKDAIFTVDVSKRNLKKKLVFSVPEYDVNGSLLISPKTHKILGVTYLTDRGKIHYWDETAQAFQDKIDKALPTTRNRIISMSRDENRYIVYASSMVQPGIYYVGDKKSGRLGKILENYPGLNSNSLSGKEVIEYTSRDGLKIKGYLTLPKGKDGKQLPAVIFPHGGPGARDYLGFDYWSEFLASRGYAVLQMDFRGSAGHGGKHFAAGLKNWGLEMQDDITDGAKWLVDEGVASPDRMCILGGSYGGYAALMGAVKTPGLYRCAVSFAGVSDLKLLVRNRFHFKSRAIVEEQIGDNWEDSERLTQTSPAKQADRIQIPILLAHGDEDRVVDIKHSERMAKALRKGNKSHVFLELENGDHGLSLQENRMKFFEALASFLEKHL